MVNSVRVMIVDDHPIVRKGIRSVLANYADLKIVGEASSALNLFATIKSADPAVILLDMRMSGQNGIAITQRLKQEYPKIKVIILSAHDDEEFRFGALQAGAEGYLLKREAPKIIGDSIRRVANGERLGRPGPAGKVRGEQ